MTDAANKLPETTGTMTSEVVKAQFLGTGRDGTEASNVLETPEEQRALFHSSGAIMPPLDPVSLAHLLEMSGALRSNIDAYSVNIDSFGHRFEPVIDLKADDAFERVKLAMVQERILGVDPHGPAGVEADPAGVSKVTSLLARLRKKVTQDRVPDPGELPEPSDAEVTARMESLRREMVRERLVVERFFAYCTVDESFEHLRVKTRQDVEATGNGYWEVLRNADDAIVQFNHVPGFSVRLMPMERTPTQVMMSTRATLITPSVEPVVKRFRRYAQVALGAVKGNLVWFKELGDERVMSSRSGKYYASPEVMRKKEPDASEATELVHFKIHNSRSPYGVPRWVSEMLAVVGTRHAEEINLAFFENKSMPPMAITVSGGRLVEDDVTRLENYIKNEIRGKRNFHKIMILQAESGDSALPGLSTGRAKIELHPLTQYAQDDAQFMKYMERNTDMIGSVFRLPRLLRGDARDFNRATAQTSLEMTEQQVFAPLRKDFDHFINRCILPALGINFWRFVSKGPDFSDPTQLLEALQKIAEAGFLTPEELRPIAAKGFGVDFPSIDADWMTRPLQMTLAGISTAQTSPDDASAAADEVDPGANQDNENAAEDSDLAKEAERLVALHKRFAAEAMRVSEK
jgi:PBSX family phage portal protein